MARQGKFYTGTSNIVLPVTKKDFPAAYRTASRLQYYSTLFNSVEVNSTFYKLPKAATFAKWANEVPDDFRFTAKLWRNITHARKLAYNPEDIKRFMETVDGAGTKKGCLLIQFPASITNNYYEHIANILDRIQKLNQRPAWQLCIEFRHNSWYEADTTGNLLDTYNAAMVGHDMPNSITAPRANTHMLNLRFHGTAGDYRGSYTPEVLHDYASRIRIWLNQGKNVYTYFNNTLGEAFHNARDLQALIAPHTTKTRHSLVTH